MSWEEFRKEKLTYLCCVVPLVACSLQVVIDAYRSGPSVLLLGVYRQ